MSENKEIKLRFKAYELRQIAADLKACGMEGDAAFTKVSEAIAKPSKAVQFATRDVNVFMQALKNADRESTALFRRLEEHSKAQNPYFRMQERAHEVFVRRNIDRAAEEGGGLSAVAAAAGGPVGIGLAAGIGAAVIAYDKLAEHIREAGESAEKLIADSERLGISAQALQRWRIMGEEAGISIDKVDEGLKNLLQRIGSMRSGIGNVRFAKVFEQLGISPEELSKAHTAEEVAAALAEKLKALNDPALAFNYAHKLGLDELLPLLLKGAEGLKELGLKADDSGRIISTETAEALAKANRELKAANDTIGAQLLPTLASFDGAVADSMKNLSDWVVKLSDWLRGVRELTGLGKAVVENAGPKDAKPAPAAFTNVPALGYGPWRAFAGVAGGFMGMVTARGREARLTEEKTSEGAKKGKTFDPVAAQKLLDAQKEFDKAVARNIDNDAHQKEMRDQIDVWRHAGVQISATREKQLLASAAALDNAKANAAAAKSQREVEKAAREQERALQSLTDLKARLIDHTSEEQRVTEALAKAHQLGGKAAAEAAKDEAALLDAARQKDQAEQIDLASRKAAALRAWDEAAGGAVHSTANLNREEAALSGVLREGVKVSAEAQANARALAIARDKAADAAKALGAARAAVRQATEGVTAGDHDPTDRVTGRYDPEAALRQWQAHKAAIIAEAEENIRRAHREAVEAGTETEVDAEDKAQREIQALQLAYARESAEKLIELRRKAAEAGYAVEHEKVQQLEQEIDRTAGDIGNSLVDVLMGKNPGDVGKQLAQSILRGLLQGLIGDPITAEIRAIMRSIMMPQDGASAGLGANPFGGLFSGVSSLFSGATSAIGSFLGLGKAGAQGGGGLDPAIIKLATTALTFGIPGLAGGTDAAYGGMRWVGEMGKELMFVPPGAGVMPHQNSLNFLANNGFAGRVAGGGPTQVTNHYHLNTTVHADNAVTAGEIYDAIGRSQQQAVATAVNIASAGAPALDAQRKYEKG